MNLQNKLEAHKNIISTLANDIKSNLPNSNIEIDEVITILLIIILMNFPGVKTPKDINTMLIRNFSKTDAKNDVYKINNLPYNVMIDGPDMSIETYFLLMKEQLENTHSNPTIISISPTDFLYKLFHP